MSDVYDTRDRAVVLVRAAKFSRYPDFRNNEEFWREIFYEGANGAVPDYCHRILDAFELSYAHHAVVKELRKTHYACRQSDASPYSSALPADPGVSLTAREMFRDDLSAAAATASCETALVRWTLPELTAFRDRLEAWQFRVAVRDAVVARAVDVLEALGASLATKPLLSALGASDVKLDYLKHIYWQTVGRLPSGNTLEKLVIEAAAVSVIEDRTSVDVPLTALARYVLGIASHCGTGHQHPGLLAWLHSRHCQLADAQEYLAARRRAAWLLIDCGDEPRRQAQQQTDFHDPHVRLRGVLHSSSGNRLLEHESSDGFKSALRGLLEQVGAERNLVVDLAVPCALMGSGLEHLPVVKAFDGYESLSAMCRPRLRWSLRLHHATRHGRPDQRPAAAAWNRIPQALRDEVVSDREALRSWLDDRRNRNVPYLVGGSVAGADFDPIRMLLHSGRAYIIWFAHGADPVMARKIARAAKRLPPTSRRIALPEQLNEADRQLATIIWDDPDGREGFTVPTFLPGLED